MVVRDAQQEVAEESAAAGESDVDPDELVENLMGDFPFEVEEI